MRLRISTRGCVRPSVGPSVRPSVRRSVGPSRVIFRRVLGASCAVYPALFPKAFYLVTPTMLQEKVSILDHSLACPSPFSHFDFHEQFMILSHCLHFYQMMVRLCFYIIMGSKITHGFQSLFLACPLTGAIVDIGV